MHAQSPSTTDIVGRTPGTDIEKTNVLTGRKTKWLYSAVFSIVQWSDAGLYSPDAIHAVHSLEPDQCSVACTSAKPHYFEIAAELHVHVFKSCSRRCTRPFVQYGVLDSDALDRHWWHFPVSTHPSPSQPQLSLYG